MEENMQTIPPVYTMPTPPAPLPSNRRKKSFIIFLIIALLLGGAFAAYWSYFRDTGLSEQDKLNILEQLKRDSTASFTPEEKEQIVSNLASQNNASTNLSDEEKLRLLNSVGGGTSTTNE